MRQGVTSSRHMAYADGYIFIIYEWILWKFCEYLKNQFKKQILIILSAQV